VHAAEVQVATLMQEAAESAKHFSKRGITNEALAKPKPAAIGCEAISNEF